ncbi:MAG: ImmA/IrrE family metallo-endopeptidase [Chloracidobacterium sp.]|nr:ImmA/IrrE family metallo-endopeptidase [Chloracidobacterium sp.]
MKFIIEKLCTLRIGWNERVLAESDFHRLCRRFRIRVDEMPLRPGGFYYRLRGRDFIAIDSRLTGVRKLAVQFHELGHFLLHTPESGTSANFHRVGTRTRKELEADAFALCAIIPLSLFESRTPAELIDDGFPADLVADRIAIFDRYGI